MIRRRDFGSPAAVAAAEPSAGGAGGPPMTSVGASAPGWSNFWVGVSSLIGPSRLWQKETGRTPNAPSLGRCRGWEQQILEDCSGAVALVEIEQYTEVMILTVDPASALPLFEQLVTGIRGQIIGGSLSAGERLPAARELAESLDINVHTVLRAYQILRDEGFLDLRRGRGAIVADRARDYDELDRRVAGLVAEAQRLGLTPAALSSLIREAYE